MPPIDLRSDTVTRPSPAMRAAMAMAEVGDDVYGEDPSVRALEERVAALLGKESALFVPSGTMGNQIALLVHTRPGDEVVIGEGSHCAWYESGAGAAFAGVQFAVAGQGGLFSADELKAAIKPRVAVYPRSSLVVVENTHNRSGGRTFPEANCREIAAEARSHGLALHLDGARIWNAAVALHCEPKALAAPFDTVSVCFSKGLGAPVGSAFVGSRDQVREAWRFRKMLGGGMRQAGILAAAALFALEQQRERLTEDHENAQRLAALLGEAHGLQVRGKVETNIVILATVGDAQTLSERAAERGVLISALGPNSLRAVTHLDVSRTDIERAAAVLCELAT
jgi:threonine aldolase